MLSLPTTAARELALISALGNSILPSRPTIGERHLRPIRRTTFALGGTTPKPLKSLRVYPRNAQCLPPSLNLCPMPKLNVLLPLVSLIRMERLMITRIEMLGPTALMLFLCCPTLLCTEVRLITVGMFAKLRKIMCLGPKMMLRLRPLL